MSIVYTLDIFAKYAPNYRDLPDALVPYIAKTNPDKEYRKGRTSYKHKGQQMKKSWIIIKQIDGKEHICIKDKIMSMLNKLSNKNFDEISKQIMNINVENRQQLEEMVHVIFIKTIREKGFSEMYTRLCKILIGCYVEDNGKKYYFRELLLNHCQMMFEQSTSTTLTDTHVDDKEKLFKLKDNILGCIRFIGELYNHGMITDKIIYSCFVSMNVKVKSSYLYIIDSLCLLLEIVGTKLFSQNYSFGKRCIEMLVEIKNTPTLPSAYKFVIMDLFDKYKNKYQNK